MKIAKKSWERNACPLALALLILCFVSIALMLISPSLWFYGAYTDCGAYTEISAIILGASALLCGLFFLWRTYSRPCTLAVVSFLLAVALVFGGALCIITSYSEEIEQVEMNLAYSSQLKEWEDTDPTPDTEITIVDLRKMGSEPSAYIRFRGSRALFAELIIGIIGVMSFIVSAFFLFYCVVWILRYISATADKRVIRARKKAYKEIDKFHAYKEKGVMSDEEFEDVRQRILDTL